MKGIKPFSINKYFYNDSTSVFLGGDCLPVEQALQIYLYNWSEERFKEFTLTMRTPDNDEELAIGFLLSEKIIQRIEDVISCVQEGEDRIYIKLSKSIDVDKILRLKRNFIVSSSCGICGDISINHEKNRLQPNGASKDRFEIHKSNIFKFIQKSEEQQNLFKSTGGLHASTLFNVQGDIICLREDVGRHNALDKINGYAAAHRLLPLSNHVLLLSGRVSYELIQKADASGIRAICALGAPSSLAVESAKKLDITLIGFMTPQKFNVYHQSEQVSIL